MTDTDKTAADATTIAAGADSQAGSPVTPPPFAEEHRTIFQELAADVNVLLTKLEDTRAITGATQAIENAKAALIAVGSHLFAHFEELQTKAEGELESIEGEVDEPAPAAPTETATGA